ncbi:hypothetical protein C789_4077 [Microcystis aeruginosa FACHB-905 = DIANCHI905]|uniref:Uncharacterized protein n=1 Tax=Microcystis aeruginosa PCC 7806SL TaxID=1903187 RepID=A0AB33BTU6_MICA7|nr:hypothetical protein BH695_2018 [Microcystis aeruginosa PCC 7806SL]ELS46132.1 hypothetical protein C789_4077 [Microcystis aeruginosa FACHB-905 = DIANCHI905]
MGKVRKWTCCENLKLSWLVRIQETGELRMSNNQLNGLFRDFLPVNLALPYLWS